MLQYEIPSTDPRLGRHVQHADESRRFALPSMLPESEWRFRVIRLYDPLTNPNQTIGNCTGCSKAMQFNAVGNRRKGIVLRMNDADTIYSRGTHLDPFPGDWPPTDTGSSGLGVAKAAQQLGLGGEYRWIFGGADGVVDALMHGQVVSVGTRWDNDMFERDDRNQIHPGGGTAGGHQWTVRGFHPQRDVFLGRCWWGEFRDFWIARSDLDSLLADDGDAHVQNRL